MFVLRRFCASSACSRVKKLDWFSRDSPDGEQRPAACIAFHFRQNDARKADTLIELSGHRDSVLAGHGIGNEQDLVRHHRRLNGSQFVHEFVIDVQTPARIEHYDIKTLRPAALNPVPTDADHVLRRRPRLLLTVHIHI